MIRNFNGNKCVHELIDELDKSSQKSITITIGINRYSFSRLTELQKINEDLDEYDLVL